MELISKKTGINYFELLESIDGELILLEEQKETDLSKKRYFAIRHDLDYYMAHPLEVANAEFERGFRATCFLHPNRTYFTYDKEFISYCQELIDLAHTIGYHNDALARWFEAKGTLPDIIGKPLDFLRANGFDVKGTAAHGSKICLDNNRVNYDIWFECPYTNGSGPPWRVSLKDFRLEYEAYFLQRDAYLSDNHGGWSGGIGEQIAPFELPGVPDNQIMHSIIDRFNGLDHGMLQLTIHPVHWEFK